TKGKINALLSGILMMIALYSINLRIMGQPTLSLLKESTVIKQLKSIWGHTGIDSFLNGVLSSLGLERLPATWGIVLVMALVTLLIKLLTDYYLQTEIGLALRATGDNQRMIR